MSNHSTFGCLQAALILGNFPLVYLHQQTFCQYNAQASYSLFLQKVDWETCLMDDYISEITMPRAGCLVLSSKYYRKTPHWNSQPKWETSVQLSGKITILKSYRINYLILFMLWRDECLGNRLEQETEAVLLTSRLIILIARNIITAKKNDSYALIHSVCQNNASVK